MVAPTGYGKTTLLEQWAERDERQFIWLVFDSGDDPAAPLSQIEAALGNAQGSRHATRSEPVVVVVDDAHLLGAGARLALAELAAPGLPTAARC